VNITEKAILEELDRAVASAEVRALLQPAIERVCEQLTARPQSVMTWEPVPLSTFEAGLPAGIRSAWIFVLRAGANTGAERHPNSHQRMMSLGGSGDMQIRAAADEVWTSHLLVSDRSKPLEERWISIAPNVWHQPVIPPTGDWVVVSFHTAPAEELIEERPAPDHESGSKQMRYLEPHAG